MEEIDPLHGDGGGGRAGATHLELSETSAFRGNEVEDGTLHGDGESGCMSTVPLESDGLGIGRVDLLEAKVGKGSVPGLVDKCAGDNVLKVKMSRN